ncbi:MAG: CvpA family protein [Rikenellaceae bacterium]|jgi:membrane protein required for colicin V production|nr:CvpA family protein [Rikenellaceae bacterium]
MNWIDIIIIIPMLWALYRGWRSGIFIQVGMIAGLIVGIVLACFIGTAVTSWLNVTNPVGKIVTNVALAGVALFCVVWIARTISEAFSSAGLGVVDQVGGAVFSLIKMVIIVSVVLCGFQWLNNKKTLLSEDTLEGSALYYPVMKVTSYAFPFMELAREKIDEWHEQDDARTEQQRIEEERERIPNNR